MALRPFVKNIHKRVPFGHGNSERLKIQAGVALHAIFEFEPSAFAAYKKHCLVL
jgi:hypothetical protein